MGCRKVITALAATAWAATPAAAEPPRTGYTLMYQDEFNGSAVNVNDWYHRIIESYKRANGYVRENNVTQANGVLRLRYNRQYVDGDQTLDYVGGGIFTRKLLGYGYYEVRARLLDSNKGLHTSFWSMGTNLGFPSAGEDPQIAQDISNELLPEFNRLYEIDGFEADSPRSIDMGTIAHTTNSSGDRLKYNYSELPKAEDLGLSSGFGSWHVYGYEYTPTQVKFYIDGDLKFTVNFSEHPNVFNPMNFWLTALPFPEGVTGIDDAAFPGYSEFDYFRYYTRPLIGANLLGNGDFDAIAPEPDSLVASAGWIEAYDKGASRLTKDFPFNGTRRLEHKWATAYRVTTKQNLEFIPDGLYRLTAYVKSSGGQSRAEMRVLNYGGSERTVRAPTTNDWTLITIDGISVTNNKATVAFTSEASANQWMYVDKVVFARQ